MDPETVFDDMSKYVSWDRLPKASGRESQQRLFDGKLISVTCWFRLSHVTPYQGLSGSQQFEMLALPHPALSFHSK